MYQRALQGVRIADFSWVVAGPYCTKLLALMGAEVIKIESSTRAQYKNRGGWTFSLNDSKKSCTINLSTEEGRLLVRDLVAKSDVIVENFSTGVMDRLGLSYEEARSIKPDIVYVSSSGVGRSGPAKDLPAYGSLLQGFSGWTSLFGEPNPRMEAMGVDPSWTDPLTGTWEAFIIQCALLQRERTGKGAHIDLSMLESAVMIMGDVYLAAAATGKSPVPGESYAYAHAVPHGIYPCRGPDSHIAISVEDDESWQGLRKAMKDPEWCRDASMATIGARQAQRSRIDRLVAEWTSTKPVDELFRCLQEAGVAAARCADFRQVMDNPQIVARRLFRPIEHGDAEALSTGLPWTDGSGWNGDVSRAPALGEHNDYVFKELLGMSDDAYQAYRAAGIIA
jgi:benzylsuccinate CoA-transferase BbsF subunit